MLQVDETSVVMSDRIARILVANRHDAVAMKRAFAIAAFCLAGASCASDRCSPATEDDPALCPLRLPAITSIRIDHTGVKDPTASNDPLDCSAFRPDEQQIRRFLTRAKRVDETGFHRLDWSPCSADGVVQFADGKLLHWRINLSRAGSLSSGPDGAKYWQNLYCPDCAFPPFVSR